MTIPVRPTGKPAQFQVECQPHLSSFPGIGGTVEYWTATCAQVPEWEGLAPTREEVRDMANREIVKRRCSRPLEELLSSGLLYHLNKNFFFPQGLCLALDEQAGKVVGWKLFAAPAREDLDYECIDEADYAARAARTFEEARSNVWPASEAVANVSPARLCGNGLRETPEQQPRMRSPYETLGYSGISFVVNL